MREVPELTFAPYSFWSKRTSSKLLNAGLPEGHPALCLHFTNKGEIEIRKRKCCSGHFLGTESGCILLPCILCPTLQQSLRDRDLPPEVRADRESSCHIPLQGAVSRPWLAASQCRAAPASCPGTGQFHSILSLISVLLGFVAAESQPALNEHPPQEPKSQERASNTAQPVTKTDSPSSMPGTQMVEVVL